MSTCDLVIMRIDRLKHRLMIGEESLMSAFSKKALEADEKRRLQGHFSRIGSP